MVAGLLVLAVAVASVALLWYLPVPRRWWSLALLVLVPGTLVVVSGLIMARGLRGSNRQHGGSNS
jgi:hypothetical protein